RREDARRLGAKGRPHRVGVAELLLVEPLAQAFQDRLGGLHPDVGREHHFFQLLQYGRVDLFLAFEERGELREEAGARRGEALADGGDLLLVDRALGRLALARGRRRRRSADDHRTRGLGGEQVRGGERLGDDLAAFLFRRRRRKAIGGGRARVEL